jgi:serine/threonine protein kinase
MNPGETSVRGREPMTGVGADNTIAHNGTGLEGEAESLPFGAGDRIADKYEVIRALGSGGMAFVVAARNVELDEIVALKVLRPEFLVDANLMNRFDLEARASAQIENEHVARIFDVGAMPDGAPFIVREYFEGKDLGALLREEERRQSRVPANFSCRDAKHWRPPTRLESCTVTSNRATSFWRARPKGSTPSSCSISASRSSR